MDLPFPVLHSIVSKQTKNWTVAQSLIVTGSYRNCLLLSTNYNRYCKSNVNTSSPISFVYVLNDYMHHGDGMHMHVDIVVFTSTNEIHTSKHW